MRRFDLVLYGATGFVGRRAAAYLAQVHEERPLKWAIAGRDARKLGALRTELAERYGADGTPPEVIVADAVDAAALDAMARAARVLISTAGPYALYGDGVVAACVRHGTHYADITGETAWVRKLIDRHDARAAHDATRIVPFCGFDSVPSDLGTLLLVRHMQQTLGAPCEEVTAYFRLAGGINGGTLATNFARYDSGQADASEHPFLLDPPHRHSPADLALNRDLRRAHYDATAKAWVAPFVMAPINTRVVRRSAALAATWGEPYGPRFRYQEVVKVRGRFAPVKARVMATALATFDAAMKPRVTRSLLRTLLPKPGAGPSEEVMAAGWFTTEFVGRAANGRTARARIAFRGDPGNRATLRMLCEAGLALAFDRDRLPGAPDRGGVLTPATALGEALVPRLRAAGFEIEVADGAESAGAGKARR
jgi:short subunit dehydrogenase-like uncharacterized protein